MATAREQTIEVLRKAGIHIGPWEEEQIAMGIHINWERELEKARRIVAEKTARETTAKEAHDEWVARLHEQVKRRPTRADKLPNKLAEADKILRNKMRDIRRHYVGDDGVSSDEE
jgi:hypothetical protein